MMKKVLFATTALVATASVAAADVRFSGYGRFGVGYLENRSATVPGPDGLPGTADDVTVQTPNTIVVSRFRLNIDGSAETDGGVVFSARVRMQADEIAGGLTAGEANAAGLNGARFSVEFGGLRVDVGNAAGAIDNLPNYYGNEPGLENFIGQYAGVNYGFMGYSSGGAGSNGIYARYAVGDFAVAASYDQAQTFNATTGAKTSADRWDIHAAYTFGNITAAVAYGENDANQSLAVLTLGGSWGPFSGTVFLADDGTNVAATDDTAYGLSAAYDIGSATTLTFAYGDGSASGDTRQYGIGVIHDLGGGVSLRGGVGSTKVGAGQSQTRADFGAQFNF